MCHKVYVIKIMNFVFDMHEYFTAFFAARIKRNSFQFLVFIIPVIFKI